MCGGISVLWMAPAANVVGSGVAFLQSTGGLGLSDILGEGEALVVSLPSTFDVDLQFGILVNLLSDVSQIGGRVEAERSV